MAQNESNNTRKFGIMDKIINIANKILPKPSYLCVNSIQSYQKKLRHDEEIIINTASKNRKKEFTAGRVIARKLLDDIGIKVCSILRDKNGCPIWPKSKVRGLPLGVPCQQGERK